MQEPRRRLLPRDDQDSYDAMTIRRDPKRESELLVQSRENPRDVIPPLTHTYVTSEPTHLRDLRYKSSATEH